MHCCYINKSRRGGFFFGSPGISNISVLHFLPRSTLHAYRICYNNSVRDLPICLSVTLVPSLCQNDWTVSSNFFTTWQPHHFSFPNERSRL